MFISRISIFRLSILSVCFLVAGVHFKATMVAHIYDFIDKSFVLEVKEINRIVDRIYSLIVFWLLTTSVYSVWLVLTTTKSFWHSVFERFLIQFYSAHLGFVGVVILRCIFTDYQFRLSWELIGGFVVLVYVCFEIAHSSMRKGEKPKG